MVDEVVVVSPTVPLRWVSSALRKVASVALTGQQSTSMVTVRTYKSLSVLMKAPSRIKCLLN